MVTLDNPENPAVGLRNSLPWIWLHRIRLVPYYVGTMLDRRRLVEALEGVGFEVTGVDAVQYIPRVLAVASGRLVAGLGWDRVERTFLKSIAAAPVTASGQRTSSNSTSKTSVAFGGIGPCPVGP